MMFLELTLYFLIGVTCLLFSKTRSLNQWKKAVVLVMFWPFYILLKYVECTDSVKNKDKRQFKD